MGALRKCERVRSPAQVRKNIVAAVVEVAESLGNTPAICRKSYVHPAVFDSYRDGTFFQLWKQPAAPNKNRAANGLPAGERPVLHLLQQRLAQETKGDALRQDRVASLPRRRKKSRKSKASVRS